jgi:NADH-quinone oxidoreductase subunit M
MVNHGLSTGALFLLVGMIYDRRHTRMIKEYGGIARVMPVFATFFMIVALSSAGLPGLNGFVGEFLILIGAFKSQFFASPWYAICGASGVIFAAVYLLWSYQQVFFGNVTKAENENLRDLSTREWAVLVPVLVFIVWIGFYPSTFLNKSAAASKALIQQIESARKGQQVKMTYRLETSAPDAGRE